MSSISFPHAGHPDARPPPSSGSSLGDSRSPGGDGTSELEYFASSFQGALQTNGGFQMNPLSSHPPRTRTPRGEYEYDYGGDIYTPKEELIEQQRIEVVDEDEDDAGGDDEKAGEKVKGKGRPRVRFEEVWHDMLKTAYGRDKTFKAIQYSMRLYLLFHTSLAGATLFRGGKRRPWEAETVKRLETAIGGFSMTRKCLILFNWLGPLTSILSSHSSSSLSSLTTSSTKPKSKPRPLLHAFLHAPPPVLLDLVNGLSDDIYTLHRLGLLGPRVGARAAYYADWCWFFTTLVNLVENAVERGVILEQQHQVESRLYTESMSGATAKSNPTATKLDGRELARLQRQDHWIVLSRVKLLMDLIFVSYDVFNFRIAKTTVQTVTGLAAALLSIAKAFEKHKTDLLKAQKY
ncbi:hypothetical protein EIP86_008714 [Pleurotus ostreatoroseus]|nr:hypothetical protein EIP86_008714 [Pleurotus ostreatoroseus]